jgi:retron-type reverse transcriptase
MHNVYQKDSKFIKALFQIIQEQGFQVNEEKTRLQKKGSRQEVTGLIVSDKVNVTRKYIEDIRNILYIWQKYGLAIAYHHFIPVYHKEKGHVKKGEPVLENVIAGKLDYLKMVKGENDSTYLKLKSKYDMLMDISVSNDAENPIKYLDTRNLSDFEKAIDTKIKITLITSKSIESIRLIKVSNTTKAFFFQVISTTCPTIVIIYSKINQLMHMTFNII